MTVQAEKIGSTIPSFKIRSAKFGSLNQNSSHIVFKPTEKTKGIGKVTTHGNVL